MKLNELMKLEEAALKAETAQEGKEWVQLTIFDWLALEAAALKAEDSLLLEQA